MVVEDWYLVCDVCELVDVDYELWDFVVDVCMVLDLLVLVICIDLEGKSDNYIFDWEIGDVVVIEVVFVKVDVVV